MANILVDESVVFRRFVSNLYSTFFGISKDVVIRSGKEVVPGDLIPGNLTQTEFDSLGNLQCRLTARRVPGEMLRSQRMWAVERFVCRCVRGRKSLTLKFFYLP